MNAAATLFLSVWLANAPQSALPATPALPAEPATPAPSPSQTHIYFGLWSTHLNADRLHIDSNNVMIGVTRGPVFATTFVNSFGRRAYAAGFQRAIVSKTRGNYAASLGFRLGAISGYDERFWKFAKDTPVLPMFSVYSLFEEKHLGVEVSWTMVVASAALSFRF
jgi:hypothetical protein